MAGRAFVFELQPLLDNARDEKSAAEDALELARIERRRQAVLGRWLDRGVRRAEERCEAARRALFGCRQPLDAAACDAHIKELLKALQQARASVENHQSEVRWADERVALRSLELAEAIAALNALERLRDQRRGEHEAAADRREEQSRDDDSIQGWSRNAGAP